MVEDVVESLDRNASRAGSYHMTFSGGPCVGTRASAMMVCPACFKVTQSRELIERTGSTFESHWDFAVHVATHLHE